MAKVPFTKLKCKINMDEIPVQIGEETIAVKQYLPIQDKLALISRVIEYAHMEDENYSNPVKAAAIRDIEIVFAYTNINFTEKQKEDLAKLYDQLYSSGVLTQIIKNIPEEEYSTIVIGVEESIEAIYKYLNSVVGVLDLISKKHKEDQFDVEGLKEGLRSLQESSLLKDIAPLLGLE